MSKEDVLKKPVHVAILKPAHIQKLAKEGKLPSYILTKQTPETISKPVEEKKVPELPAYRQIAKKAAKQRSQTMLRTKLRVIHEHVDADFSATTDKIEKPPCETCQAVCCVAFLVNISKEEYDSGLYGDYAVTITEKDKENLGKGVLVRLATMNAPTIHYVEEDKYFIEGSINTPCPFLTKSNKCSIYDKRPVTCRVYSCVDDDRVTKAMREGL